MYQIVVRNWSEPDEHVSSTQSLAIVYLPRGFEVIRYESVHSASNPRAFPVSDCLTFTFSAFAEYHLSRLC